MNITYRAATHHDAEEISRLMAQVHQGLENKSLFVCDGIDFIRDCISNSDHGFGVVACTDDGSIVGSFILYFPHMNEDNLGRDIGLTGDELHRVAHMESAVVAEEHRGRGIQLEMLRYAEERIDRSRYKYCLATVSPDNPASFRSLEKNGYRHVTTKEKYNGLVRRIYQKDL